MKKYKITLGNPCSFGWQNMQANKSGRFCSQCNKTVVDFTVMSDEQVVAYLLSHQGVCGHFNKTQLGRTMAVQGPAKFSKQHWPAIAAMLVAGFFQLLPLSTYANQPTQQKNGFQQVKNSMEPLVTEPTRMFDHDSVTTLRIQVISIKNKKPIPGTYVTIEGAGQFISDAKGYITLTVNIKKMPEYFRITAYSSTNHSYDAYIHLSAFIKNPYYQLELQYNDHNLQVDGEVSIDPQ